MKWKGVVYGRYVAASRRPGETYLITRLPSSYGSRRWRMGLIVLTEEPGGTELVSSEDYRTLADAKKEAGKMERQNPRQNPSILALVNPPGELLAEAVYSITYRHADDGEDYEHEFSNPEGVKIVEQSRSRVLLFGDGLDILDSFEVEG